MVSDGAAVKAADNAKSGLTYGTCNVTFIMESCHSGTWAGGLVACHNRAVLQALVGAGPGWQCATLP